MHRLCTEVYVVRKTVESRTVSEKPYITLWNKAIVTMQTAIVMDHGIVWVIVFAAPDGGLFAGAAEPPLPPPDWEG